MSEQWYNPNPANENLIVTKNRRILTKFTINFF